MFFLSEFSVVKYLRNRIYVDGCWKFVYRRIKMSEEYAKSPTLRRQWALRLGKEHRDICWMYGIALRPPVIEVIASTRKWGCYRRNENTIQLSEELICRHSWDVVVQVLKHEMAHQAAAELFSTPGGHGKAFRQAAEQLGLDPLFARASGDLPRTLSSESIEDKKAHRLNLRVRKLLSLASSGNEHEARLAMQKASLLIAKYNLEIIRESDADAFQYRIIRLGKKNISAYQRLIGSLLREHFFVEVVLSSSFDAENVQDWRTIELIGTRENLDNAEYVYHFLDNRLQNHWLRYKAEKANGCHSRKAFMLGMLNGFEKQLQHSCAATSRPDMGRQLKELALRAFHQDENMRRFMKRRFPRLSSRKSRREWLHAASYDAGHQEGSRLILNRAMAVFTDKQELLPDP
jgi:hypothetical protein